MHCVRCSVSFQVDILCLLLRIGILSTWWCKFTDASPFSAKNDASKIAIFLQQLYHGQIGFIVLVPECKAVRLFFPHAFVFTFSHAFVAHTLPKNKCVCTCVSFWHAFKNVFAWKFDRALTRLQYNLIQLHVDMMKHLSMWKWDFTPKKTNKQKSQKITSRSFKPPKSDSPAVFGSKFSSEEEFFC